MQVAKVQELSLMESMTRDPEEAGLHVRVSAVFKEILERSAKSPCDETYCAVVGNAIVSSLMNQALVEHNIATRQTPEANPPTPEVD